MPFGRRSAVVVAILSTSLVLTVIGAAATAATAPSGLSRFMYAVGQVESGGNYYARNETSGAYGKYQIMPSNWPSWAETYLGDRYAKQTPENQEIVAAGKMTDLFESLGLWKRVAYWWLTGSKATTGWSSYATSYVNKVMTIYYSDAAGTAGSTTTTVRYGETSTKIAYSGTWKLAEHTGYTGDKVRYATAAGATATFTFTGTKVSWYGPVGPTRGKARVYVDGTYIKTVDLYRSGFDARELLFRKTWESGGDHSVMIKVAGTDGRPVVAIDEFVITR